MIGGATAPWWGVPVVAGTFLVLGGVLSFLFTRWNDSAKYERERSHQRVKELVELGAQVTTAATAVREIALLGLRRSLNEFAPIIAAKGRPAIDELTLTVNRFRLRQPLSMNKETAEYLTYTMALLIPPFGKAGQEYALHEQMKASVAFTNALRKLQGEEPFEIPMGESTLRANAETSTALFMEELLEEARAAEKETQEQAAKSES